MLSPRWVTLSLRTCCNSLPPPPNTVTTLPPPTPTGCDCLPHLRRDCCFCCAWSDRIDQWYLRHLPRRPQLIQQLSCGPRTLLSVCLSVRPSVRLPVCLSVSVSVSLSLCLCLPPSLPFLSWITALLLLCCSSRHIHVRRSSFDYINIILIDDRAVFHIGRN